MAKAVAHLKCQYCGKEFEKTKICRNRNEADSWVEWMESRESCCGSCWYKNKMEEEKESGLQAKVRLGSIFNPEAELWFVLFGDTYAIKDNLKQIGAWWTDAYPSEDSESTGMIFGDLLSGPPMKRWAICCKMDEAVIHKKADELNALGFNIVFPDDASMSTWLALRKQLDDRRKEEERKKEEKQKEKEQEIEAEIAKLGPIPAWPESFPPAEGRWNGTIYGKKGNRSVYINGTKYSIEDELVDQVEQIAKERDTWNAKKKEIQEKYK